MSNIWEAFGECFPFFMFKEFKNAGITMGESYMESN